MSKTAQTATAARSQHVALRRPTAVLDRAHVARATLARNTGCWPSAGGAGVVVASGTETNNTIANVVTDVRAAEQDGIPTYVIGVLNPDMTERYRTS